MDLPRRGNRPRLLYCRRQSKVLQFTQPTVQAVSRLDEWASGCPGSACLSTESAIVVTALTGLSRTAACCLDLAPACSLLGGVDDWAAYSLGSARARVRRLPVVAEEARSRMPWGEREDSVRTSQREALTRPHAFGMGRCAESRGLTARVWNGPALKRNFAGQHFWARGYFVSTAGRDETLLREYIRHHEEEDRRHDQQQLI